MRGILLLSLLFLSSSFAGERLTLERVVEIIGKNHDDKALNQAMKIHPKARSYDIKIKVEPSEGDVVKAKVTATEKHVEGRYIVSVVSTPEGGELHSMVVEFDEESKTYRKYIVVGGKLVGYMVGTRIADTRVVSWVDLTAQKYEARRDVMLIETHTDTTTTWRAVFFEGYEIQRVETGVATVTG